MKPIGHIALALSSLLGLLCMTAPAAAQTKKDASDAKSAETAIYRRIEQVRKVVEKIKIDGKGQDWRGVPEFNDPQTDVVGNDQTRDIVQAAIAPREEDLLILIETPVRPSQEDRAFWFDVDLGGHQPDDIQIGIAKNGEHTLWVFDEGRKGVAGTIKGIEVAIDDVVEIRVPYKALADVLPAKLKRYLTPEGMRPWIRVKPFTYNARTQEKVDFGPAVACYRLLGKPLPLDPPPPRGLKGVRALDLPVTGKWYVGQGAFGVSSHQTEFAYDLYMVDHTAHPSTIRDSKRNEDYLSWNQRVVAPVAGRVLRTKKDVKDAVPRSVDFDKSGDLPLNEVFLDIGESMGLWFGHFRVATVTVEKGQSVTPGKLLGHVGNTGKSGWPHLHIGLWKLPESKISLPMALSNVRVSLNHAGEDPWTRELAVWDIREGYFVERTR